MPHYPALWYGMAWHGMVWYGMVWYGMLLLLLLGHPARAGGRSCQTRSPWAGRKGAVGRRHAGRACADDDRGGGGGGHVGGGGGARARRREEPPVCVTLEPYPRCGGEGDPTCARRRRGGGAGWRDHLFGDLRGPDSPCFRPPLPHDRGGGNLPACP